MSGAVSNSIDAIGRFIGRYPYQLVAAFGAAAALSGILGWGDMLAICASVASLLLIWKHEDANPRPVDLGDPQSP